MKGLKLPILFNTDEGFARKEMGLNVSIYDHIIRNIIFYRIDCISAYEEEGSNYTRVYSGNQDYISSLDIERVNRLIRENL